MPRRRRPSLPSPATQRGGDQRLLRDNGSPKVLRCASAPVRQRARGRRSGSPCRAGPRRRGRSPRWSGPGAWSSPRCARSACASSRSAELQPWVQRVTQPVGEEGEGQRDDGHRGAGRGQLPPAATSCHQRPLTRSACDSAIIVPHGTLFTGTPKPRKERLASPLMKAIVSKASRTSSRCDTLGAMWRRRLQAWPTPIAWAATTQGSMRCLISSPRGSR